MLRRIFGLLLLMNFAGSAALAADYALVIAAGKFPLFRQMRKPDGTYGIDLDGPRPDAEKLVELLTARFHYEKRNMTVLIDEAASRKGILGAIDALDARVVKGDHVLIYYSGHGTSSLDHGGYGMDPATGAIVPTDLDPKGDILAQLIVGNRDLRPRFTRLEEKADVLVIFDSCFSGESAKGLQTVETSAPRFVSLADLTNNAISSESIQQAEAAQSTRGIPEYPYKRIVYYAASSNSEYAQDISAKQLQLLQGKFTTVDGRPHGAFSNVLLKALAANTGTGICSALFESVRGMVVEQAGVVRIPEQHPQMLAPQSGGGQSCFAPEPNREPKPAHKSEIRAVLDGLAEQGGKGLQCRASRPDYAERQATTLTCVAPSHGFVSVLSYGEGDDKAVVLFPNSRQHSGEVNQGEFGIPGTWNFRITNVLPPGKSEQEQVMLVLFDTRPIDLMTLGVPDGVFRGLTGSAVQSLRSQIVEGYEASELVFPIHK